MTIVETVQKITAGEITAWAIVAIIVLLSLFEIAPVKINPWSHLLGWLGKKSHGDLEERMKDVEKNVQELWVSSQRESILHFARECRLGEEHSIDEWTNVLNIAESYEKYIIKNNLTNGIITQDTEYLRGLYQDLCRDQKI